MDVLHCDNHLLVVRKPAGVPTVPDASGDESLLDQGKAWVAVEFQKPGAVFLGVVHRLDRPVSGVVCFARTSKAASRLQPAFRDKRVEKRYWGMGAGTAPAQEGVIEHWLWKDRTRNTVKVMPEGREGAKLARTSWKVRGAKGGVTWLELEPHTGRSHQLRVACATLSMPLLGDLRYGAREPLPDKSVALHAYSLTLDHPTRDERLTFEAPAPDTEAWNLARGS